jgi:hypothetical protein
LLIVSPHSTGGVIKHSYADHVSIIKFIERTHHRLPKNLHAFVELGVERLEGNYQDQLAIDLRRSLVQSSGSIGIAWYARRIWP